MTLIERDQLASERVELQARLAPGALDWMGTLERSAERRAIRARIAEIELLERLARDADYESHRHYEH